MYSFLCALAPSWTSAAMLLSFFVYLAISGYILPGKLVPAVILSDGSRLHYRCNGLQVNLKRGRKVILMDSVDDMEELAHDLGCKVGKSLLSLLLLVGLLVAGVWMNHISPTAISDRGLELLSATFIFSFLASMLLHAAGCKSGNRGSSLKPHFTGNLVYDWWFGMHLNPQFLGIDLKFFFVRAGMSGWLLINLSIPSKSIHDANLSESMILYQLFCLLYILDYFFYEKYMTSTWDTIAERLGFMLVFGDPVWIPFTFSIQGGWLLKNKLDLTTAAIVANCFVFLMGYRVFRRANKYKHLFKKKPKAPIWGMPPRIIGGKLLASGYCPSSILVSYLSSYSTGMEGKKRRS